jgi:hypothetical protein
MPMHTITQPDPVLSEVASDAKRILRTEAEELATAKAIVLHGLVHAVLARRIDARGQAAPVTRYERAYLEHVAQRAVNASDPDLRVDIASDVVGEIDAEFWAPEESNVKEIARETIARYDTRLGESR